MSETDEGIDFVVGDEPIPETVALNDLLEALAVPGLGKVGARRLMARFGCMADARRAGDAELGAAGLTRNAVAALRSGELRYDPVRELARAEASAVRILPMYDAAYPKALKLVHDAPPVLYVKGELLPRDAVGLGVVGARRASVYGLMQARAAQRRPGPRRRHRRQRAGAGHRRGGP